LRDDTQFRLRGVCYHNKKELDRAIADYTEAIKLNPRNVTLYRYRGYAYDSKKDTVRALRDFDRAVELAPKDVESLYGRGLIHLAQKAYDEVIADATRALRIDPKHFQSLVIRGHAYRRVKAYERALRNFEAALKINAAAPGVHSAPAWLWATCPDVNFRDGKKALEHATRSCELTKWAPDSDFEVLAAAYAENGRFEEAVKWQKKALANMKENDPDLAEARERLKLFQEKKPYRE